jgi:predicted unusual protein kinase regulating ubiquinone biosynthesis (AarF/ABC1/UbiB family)
MNILLKVYSQLYIIVCKIKYVIYFNIFLNVLLINYLYYKLWNVFNNKLLLLFNFMIKLNGCIIIKLIQWLNTNLDLLLTNSDANEFIVQLFSQYYENCPVHELKYTKNMFLNDFGIAFDDYFELDANFSIKSGSVAQVYKATIKQPYIHTNMHSNASVAIKVIHPDIEYQLLCPAIYVKIYTYLVTNFNCLKQYDLVVDIDSFFSNLKKQINMENEFANNEYFYNYYNNNIIIIPKPLMKSKNFLVMEFIDGEQLENLDISIYKKQIIFSFISIFMKDTFINGKYIHCDLHQANWKIFKQANSGLTINNEDDFNYKIIVYDFGYVIENIMHDTLKKLCYYLDCNNLYEVGNLLFHNIKNINIDKSNISNIMNCKKDFIERFEKHNTTSYPFSDNMLITINNFCYVNGYKLNNNLLDYFISIILLNKHFKKYIFSSYYNDGDVFNKDVYIKSIYNTNMFYISICEKYNVFHNVKDYLYDTYIINSNFTKNIAYTNNYFNTLKNNTNSSTIICESDLSQNNISSCIDI